MIEFAGEDAVAAAVACEKNHIASGQFAGEQIVRGRSKRRFDLDPFLAGKPFKIVEAGAADDADARFRHDGFLTAKAAKDTKKAMAIDPTL